MGAQVHGWECAGGEVADGWTQGWGKITFDDLALLALLAPPEAQTACLGVGSMREYSGSECVEGHMHTKCEGALLRTTATACECMSLSECALRMNVAYSTVDEVVMHLWIDTQLAA